MPKHNTVSCANDAAALMAQKPTPTDLQRLGHALIEMALGNTPMPADTAAGKTFLSQNGVTVPANIMTVSFVQRDPKHLLVVLPPREMVEAAVCEARKLDEEGKTKYVAEHMPEYAANVSGDWYDEHTNEDFYDVRVADYVMSFCR